MNMMKGIINWVTDLGGALVKYIPKLKKRSTANVHWMGLKAIPKLCPGTKGQDPNPRLLPVGKANPRVCGPWGGLPWVANLTTG